MKIKSKSREVIMQIKTQKQVMVLQNKAQKVADKLTEEVIVIAKGVQHIQVQGINDHGYVAFAVIKIPSIPHL